MGNGGTKCSEKDCFESIEDHTQVIFHEIRILIEIYRFEGELSQSLSSISVGFGPWCNSSTAGFSSGSILEIHFRRLEQYLNDYNLTNMNETKYFSR